ncbi:ArdC-like ssDNA-binding domain-containing protein, partial [Magnetospirillum fulvum]
MMAETKISYRDEIAGEIIRRIEAGTAPWQKPWKPGEIGAAPFNPVSNKPYRGINDLWLSMMGRADPRWMTYRQALEIGAQVRKGERSATIEYWQWSTRETLKDADGKPVLDQDGNPRI